MRHFVLAEHGGIALCDSDLIVLVVVGLVIIGLVIIVLSAVITVFSAVFLLQSVEIV